LAATGLPREPQNDGGKTAKTAAFLPSQNYFAFAGKSALTRGGFLPYLPAHRENASRTRSDVSPSMVNRGYFVFRPRYHARSPVKARRACILEQAAIRGLSLRFTEFNVRKEAGGEGRPSVLGG
jgi:hypothetical protein